MLHRYLHATGAESSEDRALREAFEKAVRGYYRLDESGEEGRIGPIYQIPGTVGTAGTAAYARVLFKGPINQASASSHSSTPVP
jgi:hypothetical protein